MVEATDANNLLVPYGLFPSKDEPITEVSVYIWHYQITGSAD